MAGVKPVENRTWPCAYVGRLYIHAGKTWTPGIAPALIDYDPRLRGLTLEARIQRGCVLGFVEMVDCVTIHKSEWFAGPFGFVFKNPVKFDKPIPYRGRQGLFTITDLQIQGGE